MRHPHVVAAAILAGATLAYLWPVLFGGQVLSSLTSCLYNLDPWRVYAPSEWAGYYNADQCDFAHGWYADIHFVRDLIRSGTFPAWDPYSNSGSPQWPLAYPAYLSPFTAPLWILPLNYAVGVIAAVKLWVGGFGAYLLARELRLGFWPGVFAGLAFGFCASNIIWTPWPNLVAVWVMTPWALLLIERIVHRGRSSDGIWLAGVVAVMSLNMAPTYQAPVMVAMVIYACVRSLALVGHPQREQVRRLALTLVASVLGTLVAAVQLLPFLLAIPGSLGERLREGGYYEFPDSLIRLIAFPDWWGRPSGFDQVFVRGAPFTESAGVYVGAAVLVLAFVGVGMRSAWRRTIPFVIVGLVALDVGLQLGPFDWLGRHVPPFDHIQNTRVGSIFSLSMAILAAFGLERLLATRRIPQAAWWAIGAGLIIGLAGIADLKPDASMIDDTVDHFLSGRDYSVPGVVALTSVTWWLLLVGGLGLVLWLRPRLGRMFPVAVVAVLLVDLFHFANGYQPMPPKDQAKPVRPAAIAFLQANVGDARVWGSEGSAMLADTAKLYRLRDIQGYVPPEPSLRYWRLLNLADSDVVDFERYERIANNYNNLIEPMLSDVSEVVLDLLGVGYVIFPPGAQPNLSGFEPVYRGRDALIMRNIDTAPRAFVASRVARARSERESLETLSGPDRIDPTREAVVEADERVSSPPEGEGSVRDIREGNAWVELEVAMQKPGLAVLNDRLTPGWSVEVDGREAAPLRVNSVLRGVMVPAGEHEVRWSYTVPGLKAGAAISILSIMALGGWGLSGPLRRARQRSVLALRRRRGRRCGRSA